MRTLETCRLYYFVQFSAIFSAKIFFPAFTSPARRLCCFGCWCCCCCAPQNGPAKKSRLRRWGSWQDVAVHNLGFLGAINAWVCTSIMVWAACSMLIFFSCHPLGRPTPPRLCHLPSPPSSYVMTTILRLHHVVKIDTLEKTVLSHAVLGTFPACIEVEGSTFQHRVFKASVKHVATEPEHICGTKTTHSWTGAIYWNWVAHGQVFSPKLHGGLVEIRTWATASPPAEPRPKLWLGINERTNELVKQDVYSSRVYSLRLAKCWI